MSEEERARLMADFGDNLVAVGLDKESPPIGQTPDGKPFNAWCLGARVNRHDIGIYQLRTLLWYGIDIPAEAAA